MVIGYKKKFGVDVGRNVASQLGKVQRGQWIYANGRNARILNIIGKLTVVLSYDRKAGVSEVLTYA